MRKSVGIYSPILSSIEGELRSLTGRIFLTRETRALLREYTTEPGQLDIVNRAFHNKKGSLVDTLKALSSNGRMQSTLTFNDGYGIEIDRVKKSGVDHFQIRVYGPNGQITDGMYEVNEFAPKPCVCATVNWDGLL
jgi:hypothetical protein